VKRPTSGHDFASFIRVELIQRDKSTMRLLFRKVEQGGSIIGFGALPEKEYRQAISIHAANAAVSRTFLVVLLLTADLAISERIVVSAIERCEFEGDWSDALLMASVREALAVNRHEPCAGDETSIAEAGLPPELIRVANLPVRLREAFVLKELLGLPSGLVSGLLNGPVSRVSIAAAAAALVLCARQ
jgi:hypothetical protein